MTKGSASTGAGIISFPYNGKLVPPATVAVGDKSERITFPAGSKAFVIGKDGVLPEDLQQLIFRQRKEAYQQGQDDAHAKLNNMQSVQPRPEAFAQQFNSALAGYDDRTRNRILALVINEAKNLIGQKMDARQLEFTRAEEAMMEVKDNFEDLNKVLIGTLEIR